MWKVCAIILTTFYCIAGAAKIVAIAEPLFSNCLLENTAQEDAKSEKDAASFEDLFHARKLLHSVARQNILQPCTPKVLSHIHALVLVALQAKPCTQIQHNNPGLFIKNCALLI